jgi:hypothetical protein
MDHLEYPYCQFRPFTAGFNGRCRMVSSCQLIPSLLQTDKRAARRHHRLSQGVQGTTSYFVSVLKLYLCHFLSFGEYTNRHLVVTPCHSSPHSKVLSLLDPDNRSSAKCFQAPSCWSSFYQPVANALKALAPKLEGLFVVDNCWCSSPLRWIASIAMWRYATQWAELSAYQFFG